MEDKSDPRIKKVQDNRLEDNVGDGPLFSGHHQTSENINPEKYIELELQEGMMHLSLPNKGCNLNAINKLNITHGEVTMGPGLEKKNQRSLQNFWKSFNKVTGSFKITPKELTTQILRKETIDILHSELYSWHTLLRHFVSMPSLTNFNVCQVLCHEKGTTSVQSYSFGSDNQLQESKTSIESFNKVFTQIKKSKANQFSQTQLSIPEFNFAGSFLASIFQLKTHNMLFLLSENSFFPIPDEVIEEVNLINPQVKCVLEKIIEKDLSDSKVSNLFRVFELLPNPISIHNSLGVPVFQNESYKNCSPNEIQDQNNIFEIELNGDFKLVMLINSELSKSDIQHFQRVGLLGELLNTLQHELSNPLFGIQLATDFLNLQPNDSSVKESLSEISEYCKRCQDIIRDFKFIYQGGDKFLDVDLGKLIKETLTLTKSASRGIRKKIEVSSDIDKINTNPTWLSQIIFNLIINSSQAIQSIQKDQDGSGRINIIVESKSEKHIKMTIEDNGPGIEAAQGASIFDPFYTTKEKGTGLGLSICQSLSEKLGGTMTYSKNNMNGASFSLLLPINEIHRE